MATYSKPGVYVEETLTPNVPVTPTISNSVAAFIGVADRGPTTVDNSGNVIGVPTLVSSWSEFVNAFSYGGATNTFSGAGIGINQVTSTNSASGATTVSIAAANSTLSVGMSVSGIGVDPTATVADVSGTTVTLSMPLTSAIATGATLTFSNSPMKYAVKSFFDNGGSQAYILREINTNANKATAVFRDSNDSIAAAGTSVTATTSAAATNATTISMNSVTGIVAGMGISGTNVATTAVVTTVGTNSVTITPATSGTVASAASLVFSGVVFDGTTQQANNLLTITANSGTFTNAVAGNTISISGVTAAGYTFLNTGRWVVNSVDAGGGVLTIVWKGTVVAPYAQTASPTLVNVRPSSTATLTVTAKDHGIWGNNIWVGVYPNATAGYFDLHVYYSNTANASTSLTDANRVERFVKLSMDSTDSRYVVNNIASNWVTVSDNGSTATGYNDMPAFTGNWTTTYGSANNSTSDGSFVWNSAGFLTTSVVAARLGNLGTTNDTLAGQAGDNGTAASKPTASTLLYPRFDSVLTPLIFNYPARTGSTVKDLMTYAAGRGDSFVVVDTTNDTVANTLSSLSVYNTNQNYGAAYYPNIVIADPASTTGGTKTIPPGGAVAALYTVTDNSRGVFKAPAGAQTRINSAVSVYGLTNDEFNRVGGSTPNLNVIRFVPGSGICIMGARTLNSSYSDVYVPVRRSLNYLAANLKNITEFAIFEPNDADLWGDLEGVVGGFLDRFWRSGGLAGATADQAFYVKCDSTINTPAVIAAGEVRVEVGVALQRPAEFVIIKIGQIDGGATVTTSI